MIKALAIHFDTFYIAAKLLINLFANSRYFGHFSGIGRNTVENRTKTN